MSPLPQASRRRIRGGQHGNMAGGVSSSGNGNSTARKCKYFFSKAGCHKGANCKFSHGERVDVTSTVASSAPITEGNKEAAAHERQQQQEARGPSSPQEDRLCCDNSHRFNSSNSPPPQSSQEIPIHSPATTTTIECTMTELTNQMNRISNTITNSLTASSSHNNNHRGQECTACTEHTQTMQQLQSELQVALKRVERMAALLTVLQTHATLVHKSLEALSVQIVSCSGTSGEGVATNDDSVTMNQNDNSTVVRAAVPIVNNDEGYDHSYRGRAGGEVSSPPPPTVDHQTSTSRNQSASTGTAVHSILPPFLSNNVHSGQHDNMQEQKPTSPVTCPPTGFQTSTSRNQSARTAVHSPIPPPSLAKDVHSGQHYNMQEQKTNDGPPEQLLFGGRGGDNSPALSNAAGEYVDVYDESNEKDERCQQVITEGGGTNGSSKDEWSCPVCTFINPTLFLTCDACGSTAPVHNDVADHTADYTANNAQQVQLQQKEAEDKKQQEEKSRKRREKAERKKAAKLARKREEEEAAAEAEKQRQLDARREKQAAMARHEEEVRQEQKRFQRKQEAEKKKEVVSAEVAPLVPIPPSGAGIAPSPPSTPSRPLSAKKRGGVRTPSSTKEDVTIGQLSYYIKSSNKKGDTTNVSPIFDLLQCESTAEKGRQLLILESEAHSSKEELKELVGQRARLLNGIGFEERKIEQKNKAIEFQKEKMEGYLIKAMKKIGDLRGDQWERQKVEEELAAEEEPLKEELDKTIEGIDFENIPSLNELLERASSFLTCAPSKYALWLNAQGIQTSTELSMAVIEKDIVSMTSSDGAGVKLESFEEFTTLVLYAVIGKKKNTQMETTTGMETEAERKKRKDKEIKEKKEVGKNLGQTKKKKKITQNSKEAGKRITEHRKLIAISEESIKLQKRELDDLQTLLRGKMAHLQKLRADIADVKGDGKHDDVNFHIDRSRDDRGFTFLMIAAQNDDFFTAKLCFELGADPHAQSPEGLTAIDFSYFFDYKHVTDLILRNGGSLPLKQSEAWACLRSMTPQSAASAKNWDDALKVAETAALPAETLMESPDKCEADEDKRMSSLTIQERSSMDFTCFESRLLDPNINPDQVHRVVLLEQNVYQWCLSTDSMTRSNFINVLEGLKPASVRKSGVSSTIVHRRAVVGTTTTFEVLASRFEDVSEDEGKDEVVLFSPFVSGEVEGVTSIGVLVWAVVPDSEASLYKTLVANTEFMRNKIQQNDRFLPHLDEEGVLKLGKDMHLLDLHSTSIWTTAAMGLYVLNVDCGDLDHISSPGFSAKKRIVHSEEQVNKAIFRTSQEEAEKNEDILANERLDMSSLVSGGAGTGKTLLMIRKVSSEEPSRRILIVSRLPRLVNIIKTAVEDKRDDSVDNMSFTTYDDLVQLLARRVVPDEDSQYKSFVQFHRIRFDCDESNISFSREFVTDFLNSKERKQMTSHQIEPLTLWHAIIVIKSNAKCASTKEPLSLDDYIALPTSFGLTEVQRRLSYDLFLKYEQWRQEAFYWDEMDRVLYVIRHGPTVFRDDNFIPWAKRVNKFGEMNLLDDDGAPLYPFFYDLVCADEAQDFTEIDLVLFAKMSSSIRSLFLSADVAQSVELGIRMRAGTVNDVFHSLLKDGKSRQVKDVLQYVDLRTNHRTHQQNLVIGQAVRSILARSFSIPMTHEAALINGEIPKTMLIKKIRDLADPSVFQGGNIVFLAPDEKVHELRFQFQALEIHNDLFGVREAKGLEFDACALIGFFGFIDELGSKEEWQNVLRWLSSSSSITKTCSSGEKVDGQMLTDCDYRLSAPNVSDEAMMLYTALTRARNHLYLIELEKTDKGKKQGKSLAQYAFRRLSDLKLAKPVTFIKEGHAEMTPAQHKARGVLYVTQALNMSRNMEPLSFVKDKFVEALNRFGPDKGNDKELLDKCEKHLNAVIRMRNLMQSAKEKFPGAGQYNLKGRFAEVLDFEQEASKFFSEYLCDSFLVAEVHSVRLLIEEVFDGTPYEKRFRAICAAVKNLEQGV